MSDPSGQRYLKIPVDYGQYLSVPKALLCFYDQGCNYACSQKLNRSFLLLDITALKALTYVSIDVMAIMHQCIKPRVPLFVLISSGIHKMAIMMCIQSL